MNERDLRELLDDVRAGRLSRREFVSLLAGFGLTAPMAAQMFAAGGVRSGRQLRPDPRRGDPHAAQRRPVP